jgi:hypothetical protein
MTRPVSGPAPASDYAALLAAGAQAVAEARADADHWRAEASTLLELLTRYTLAASELRWSLEASDRDAGNHAAAALWLVLDDAREVLR